MILSFFKTPSENVTWSIHLFGGIRESFKVPEWTSCLGRCVCVHVRVRVCEHVKELELLCTKLQKVATCTIPSMTGNKTDILDVIRWEIQNKVHDFNVHGSVHHNNILIYIQQDVTLHSLFCLETALHVFGGTSTHHQERKQLYLQHLVFVIPWMLSDAIVEELELSIFTQNSTLGIQPDDGQ